MQKSPVRLPGKSKKTFWQIIKPYLFLLPIYGLMLTFKYIPFFDAIINSFFKWNGGNVREFIGMENYITLFHDKQFGKSLINCLLICIANLAIALTMPLLAAELLFAVRSRKAQYYLRTVITFPMVVPSVVVILLWKWILGGDTGILNTVLKNVGLESLVSPWLGSSKTALMSVVMIGFPWISGLNFLLYYGGLQNIPGELMEAATLDGTNIFQRFFRVDLPMLASQTKLIITLCLINSVQVFETIFILTKGGPGSATMVPSILLYEAAFSYKKFGYSAAIGVVMFLLILLLTVFNQRFLKDTEKMN